MSHHHHHINHFHPRPRPSLASTKPLPPETAAAHFSSATGQPRPCREAPTPPDPYESTYSTHPGLPLAVVTTAQPHQPPPLAAPVSCPGTQPSLSQPSVPGLPFHRTFAPDDHPRRAPPGLPPAGRSLSFAHVTELPVPPAPGPSTRCLPPPPGATQLWEQSGHRSESRTPQVLWCPGR